MRYRAPKKWAERADKVLAARDQGESIADLQREAFSKFLREEEKRLGIEPSK